MTREEKDLLFKDLSARLPHGVKCNYNTTIVSAIGLLRYNDKYRVICDSELQFFSVDIEKVKPYLFPLSSMTDEQERELSNISDSTLSCENGIIESFIEDSIPYNRPAFITHESMIKAIDWLNKNHFDYRGLLEKDLAINAIYLNIC